MNILFCSVGRRCELLKDFRKTMGAEGKIVATDLSEYAPAVYFADKYYLVPRIDNPDYISTILDICREEEINAVTTCIDPEIMLLAEHRDAFQKLGVEVLAPYYETAKICFDKFEMYQYLTANGVRTVLTFGDMDSFCDALKKGQIAFPVFVKPREGTQSVAHSQISLSPTSKEALSPTGFPVLDPEAAKHWMLSLRDGCEM